MEARSASDVVANTDRRRDGARRFSRRRLIKGAVEAAGGLAALALIGAAAQDHDDGDNAPVVTDIFDPRAREGIITKLNALDSSVDEAKQTVEALTKADHQLRFMLPAGSEDVRFSYNKGQDSDFIEIAGLEEGSVFHAPYTGEFTFQQYTGVDQNGVKTGDPLYNKQLLYIDLQDDYQGKKWFGGKATLKMVIPMDAQILVDGPFTTRNDGGTVQSSVAHVEAGHELFKLGSGTLRYQSDSLEGTQVLVYEATPLSVNNKAVLSAN